MSKKSRITLTTTGVVYNSHIAKSANSANPLSVARGKSWSVTADEIMGSKALQFHIKSGDIEVTGGVIPKDLGIHLGVKTKEAEAVAGVDVPPEGEAVAGTPETGPQTEAETQVNTLTVGSPAEEKPVKKTRTKKSPVEAVTEVPEVTTEANAVTAVSEVVVETPSVVAEEPPVADSATTTDATAE
jgi:hypothetical protein